MIRARVVTTDGMVSEGTYTDIEELTKSIKENSNKILTLEVDVEDSDHHRPAFWCEE
jgi:capsid portal protein